MPKLNPDQNTRQVARVYDIKDCGPRNRFVANGKLVHNSGGDRLNWQNLGRKGRIRDAIEAIDGEELCVGDSSNIEARVLDWLAMQEDAIQVYRDYDAGVGPDVYCVLAGRIYGREISKSKDPAERQMGKTAKLGLGYGMGHDKFATAARSQVGRVVPIDEAHAIVTTYRTAHPAVTRLWDRATDALKYIAAGREGVAVDPRGVIVTCAGGLRLPNGMVIKYPDLQKDKDGWSYFNGRTREKIYGAKMVENCIGGGTPVLTQRGWVNIELVRNTDLVYDGVDFVPHGGIVFKLIQPCVRIDRVRMTLDHKVLTDEGWTAALEEPRPERADFWCAHRVTPGGFRWEEDVMGFSLPVWEPRHQEGRVSNEGGKAWRHPELWMHEQEVDRGEKPNPRNEQPSSLPCLAKYARSVSTTIASGVAKLRSAWHCSMRAMDREFRGILGGHGARLPSGPYARTQEQRAGVLPGKLHMGDTQGTGTQPQGEPQNRHPGIGRTDRHSTLDPLLPAEPWPVFDILNCGPRQRFVVGGYSGPFIVHNCIQALARIIVMDQSVEINRYLPVVMSIHDEAVTVAAADDATDATEYMLEAMRKPPVWGADIPLNSEGGHNKSYGRAKS